MEPWMSKPQLYRRAAMLGALFLMAVCWPAFASGHIILPPRRPPIPHIPPRVVLEVRSLAVEISMEDRTAVTEIEQVFYNPGARLQEGMYIFPLPSAAHVENFSMYIDGVETRAELLDAKKAARIYQDIVRRMRDPALLEYLGNDLFRAKVFPIEAHAEKRVKLRYRQVLESDQGLNRYVYPLRAGRVKAAELKSFSIHAHLKVSSPLKTLYSPTHQFEIRRKGRRGAELSFEAESWPTERDVEILFSTDERPIGLDVLTHGMENERYFWMTINPDLEEGNLVAKDLILVLDTSGSMSGEKMEQAKRALLFCIDNLNREDRFAVIRFATEASTLARLPVIASVEQRAKARAFIDGFQALGGTNLEDALKLALAMEPEPNRPQVVILLTDGKPTIGERDEARLIKMITGANAHGKRVFPFGIGHEINIHLLDKIAATTGGWRTYVQPEQDLELKLSSFYEKIRSPVLSGVELEVAGVTFAQTYPHRLPDLFKGLPLHIFGKYRGEGRARIRLKGTVNGKARVFEFRHSFPARSQGPSFIAELWAQRRVGYLLDRVRLYGEEKELIDEVVLLAKRYGIITPYTSYLILEDSDRPISWLPSPAPTPVRPFYRSQDRLAQAYKNMRAKSGSAGVSASEELQRMEMADVLEDRQQAWANVAGRAGAPIVVGVQTAGGRAFYLRDKTWVDVSWDENAGNKTRFVEFAGEAYFELLSKNPELSSILALGPRVQFVLGEGQVRVAP